MAFRTRLRRLWRTAQTTTGVGIRARRFETPVGVLELDVPAGAFLDRFAEEGRVHEVAVLQRFARVLERKSVVFDVGAHMGYHSAAAVAAGVSPAHVHAFECDPSKVALYKKNTPTGTKINQCRVGDGDRSLALDDYADATGARPDVIKIDVEGSEGAVLDGLSKTLDTARPTVFVEVHPQFLGTDSEATVVQTLIDAGYRLTAFAHQDVGHECDVDSLHPRPTADLEYEEYCLHGRPPPRQGHRTIQQRETTR